MRKHRKLQVAPHKVAPLLGPGSSAAVAVVVLLAVLFIVLGIYYGVQQNSGGSTPHTNPISTPPENIVVCPPDDYQPVVNGAGLQYLPSLTSEISIPNTVNFLNGNDRGFTVGVWIRIPNIFFPDNKPISLPLFSRKTPTPGDFLYDCRIDMQGVASGECQARSTFVIANTGTFFIGRSSYQFDPRSWNFFTYTVQFATNGTVSVVSFFVNNVAYANESTYYPPKPASAGYEQTSTMPLQMSGTKTPLCTTKSLYYFNSALSATNIGILYMQYGGFGFARTLSSFRAGFRLGPQDEQWPDLTGRLLGQLAPTCIAGYFQGAQIVNEANTPVPPSHSSGTAPQVVLLDVTPQITIP